MPQFKVAPCSVDDAQALATINTTAFWADATWILMWPSKTCRYVTAQAVHRMPHTLLNDRTRKRHQKVVDSETGTVLGYARWTLPDTGDYEQLMGTWAEARVDAVNEVELEKFEIEYMAADWDYDHSLDVLNNPINEMMYQLYDPKKHILLDHLAVHPDHKGQGIASMLVNSGINAAQQLSWDSNIFVQAKKTALGVYQTAGFVLIDQLIQDDSAFGGNGEYAAYFLVKEIKRNSAL